MLKPQIVAGVGGHQITPRIGTLVVPAGNESCRCHHPQQTVHAANILRVQSPLIKTSQCDVQRRHETLTQQS